MDAAFPEIEKQFVEIVKDNQWLALAKAIGTREGTPGASSNGERLSTRVLLSRDEVDRLDHKGLIDESRVKEWAEQALVRGNRELFGRLYPFLTAGVPEATQLSDLAETIQDARKKLRVDSMDLLVSSVVKQRISANECLCKAVTTALLGGALVPVAPLGDARGYVLPHQTGVLAVEVAQAMTAEWDIAAYGGVELVATEVFDLVSARQLKAFEFTL